MPIDPAVLARLRELYDKWQASKGEREIYNALVIFALAYLPALLEAAEAGMRDTARYYCNKCVRVYEGRDDGTDVVHLPCNYAAVAVDAREKELEARLKAAGAESATLTTELRTTATAGIEWMEKARAAEEKAAALDWIVAHPTYQICLTGSGVVRIYDGRDPRPEFLAEGETLLAAIADARAKEQADVL